MDGQGFSLAERDARRRGEVAGEDSYFDGHGPGQNSRDRRYMYGYGDDFDSGSEGALRRQAARERHDSLMSSALERIARARASGKSNVNLTRDEMEALERRGGQQPEPTPPPAVVALASPPATPAKTTKGKAGSRSNSSTSLASQKGRRKTGSSLFGGQSSPSPAKSNSKAKVDRKASTEQTSPYPSGAGPPGIMIPGPNGVPVFAPIINYAPPSPEATRARSGTHSRSRSTSKHSRRESTPPERVEVPYISYPPPRFYPPLSGYRPSSSSARTPPAEDADWYPPHPGAGRTRSASGTAAYANSRFTSDDVDGPSPVPAAHKGGSSPSGRRNVSNPLPDKYSTLRRVPPSSSPLAPRQYTASDPTVGGATERRSSSRMHELERSSSSEGSGSSDDQGVQVNIVPDVQGNAYSINRAPALPAAKENEGRRRKVGSMRK